MRFKGQIVILLLLLCGIGNAVAQKRNTLIITDDHLVLQIDLQSSEKQVDSILKIAGINGAYAAKVLKGDFTAISNDGWNTAARQGNTVRFERSLTDLNNNPQSKPYQITTRIPSLDGQPGYPQAVNYGVNKYAKITVYDLSTGFTRFILPGSQQAKHVFLAGNFNNWSTLKGAMKKTDGGWLLDVKLAPGVYEYKYIVDGRWTTDPNNLVSVDDGDGDTNSVFYKYNYTFKLAGYAAAHRITLTGDFNKWNGNELIMNKKGNSWLLQLYLIDGKHLYRFLVDGQTITDPVNPSREKDEDGQISSVINLGETVNFKLTGYTNAKKVFVAGDFNKWDPAKLSFKKTADGWVLPLTLTAGNYQYKFIIDGKWITDPLNPFYATEKGETNSFLAVKPNHSFILKGFDKAKEVTLHGTFNDWEPHGFKMVHKGNEWSIKFYLKQGKYLYKYVVDGEWILDPGNKFWEQNEFDTGNSVLWIE